MQIIPVSHLKAPELNDILLETASTVKEKGGMPISFICDNCPLNQGTYHTLGGLGRACLPALGIHVYLVYDFVHIFENLRNNWITEPSKELTFNVDGNEYVAKWADIVKLYEEDKQTPFMLTKLTYSSVHPNPLQRQSIPLVWQVFHGKTYAALEALEPNSHLSRGTMIFTNIICKWYKMMNVKSKFSRIALKDDSRLPWTENCKQFCSPAKVM